MGSEGPIPITVHVTGFKRFHGVPDNPTESIVSNLKDFLKQRGIHFPRGFTLGSCTVLEAAGHGGLSRLYNIMGDSVSGRVSSSSSSNEQVIWLHFGASGGLSKFAIERQAVNEATFLYPDEHGWQPEELPIFPQDGATTRKRQSACPVETIVENLKQKGYDVAVSNDAGRFVCNYVYYHSLRFAEHNGNKSMFVHVPLFSKINEDVQMEFAAALLEAIASTH